MAEPSGRDRGLAAVVLAAGEGTRMRSRLVKVLHPLAGRPMIHHVLSSVRALEAEPIVCVIGFQEERVREALASVSGIRFAVQEDQRGTGHALRCAAPRLDGFEGDVFVCCGDTPLLSADTLEELVALHREEDAPATLLAARLEDPSGYGRVIVDDGRILRIVEEADADAEVREIRLVNAGVYCFDWPVVEPLLAELEPENVQGEEYLTDVVGLLAERGRHARVSELEDPREMTGVNDRAQLAEVEGVIRRRIRRRLMARGVTFLAPETTLVDADVDIGPDTVVYPDVLIEGASTVGREAVIGPFSRIVDSHVGRGAELRGWNHLVRTTIPNGAIVKAFVRRGAD
ncbi:MAG: NTP transferase domain-containing protein [Gemmatimonadota bacterium]|nr:NTP transferase domain-containing protein [Gemmatimonadota bacterium]